uniref:Uncharacterized protein n=1 Tax=Anopheles melas TaxID=34690 RepID=A0A182ULH6_9DIPT
MVEIASRALLQNESSTRNPVSMQHPQQPQAPQHSVSNTLCSPRERGRSAPVSRKNAHLGWVALENGHSKWLTGAEMDGECGGLKTVSGYAAFSCNWKWFRIAAGGWGCTRQMVVMRALNYLATCGSTLIAVVMLG